MIIKSIIGTACACLAVVSLNVSAAMVSMDLNTANDGLITLDTDTGLKWLDLSVTAGQSYNDAQANNSAWSYATNEQVEALFQTMLTAGSATTKYGYDQTSDYSSLLASQTIEFANLFGPTFSDSSSTVAYGLYSDASNVLRMNGVYISSTLWRGYIGSAGDSRDQYRTQSYYTIGTFLVQTSVVPVPAAAWLFGSGLIGLIGFARRKV